MEHWRKNIRLPRSNYFGHQWYFLTTCTQDRVPRLQNAKLVGEHLEFLTRAAREECFGIEAFCFMPDHLHLLVSGQHDASDFLKFIYGFKQQSAFAFKQSTGKKLWQHKSYDHILRPLEQ